MKKKILKMMLLIASVLLVLFGIITLQMLGRIRDILTENSKKTGEKVEEYSDQAMGDQITERLRDTTLGCAYVLNNTFEDFSGTVVMIADSATDIYSNPDRYGRAIVDIPQKSDIGKSMGQFLYAPDVDIQSEDIREELSMLGNLQGSMLAMYSLYPNLGAVSIGTETGIMLLAGPVLSERWDSSGNYGFLDARTRPWYADAKAAGRAVFSDVTADYDTGMLAIMCGAPIYRDKEFVGVAGAGMYLEGIESLMMNARLSDAGNSCIIDGNGKIIFSSRDQGELKIQNILGGEDSSNSQLKTLAENAVKGKNGLELLEVDGENCYVAYYPIETVGWSLISIIPEKTVLVPKEKLIESLSESRSRELVEVQRVTRKALFVILALIVAMGILVFFVANMVSSSLVKPVELLTDKVQKLEGDQLDFEWEIDTKDEVQKLATSFGLMTERMQKYISDIQSVTAEKERIGTELDLAIRIQTSMLPHEFPPFPTRKEFEIFAKMEPAREVGGDFYDYFFIDDDHLCLVVADVSGKGIPAALFMMISQTIVKSCAMLGKSAAEIITKTNEALTTNNQTGMFVTVWLGILEISTGNMSCVNAGHEYPAIKRADGVFELFKDKHGFVIGGMEGIKYKEYNLQLSHGDKLFLYTDGVPEATNSKNKMFGTDRMINSLNRDPDASPEDILKNVRDDISDFVKDGVQFDDMTMLCFVYR